MFLMTPEESLTTEDASFYGFEGTRSVPLHMLSGSLQLCWGKDTEYALFVLNQMHAQGILLVNDGLQHHPQDSIEQYFLQFLERFGGKNVRLLEDCLDWFGFDFSVLYPECKKFTYGDVLNLKRYTVDYPEFILDTAEFIEDQLVYHNLNGTLLMKGTYAHIRHWRDIIKALLLRFSRIERFHDIVRAMDTDKIESMYQKHLNQSMREGLDEHILSWEFVGSIIPSKSILTKFEEYKNPNNILKQCVRDYPDEDDFFTTTNVFSENYNKVLRFRMVKNPEDTPWLFDPVEAYLDVMPNKPFYLIENSSSLMNCGFQCSETSFEAVSGNDLEFIVDVTLRLRFAIGT